MVTIKRDSRDKSCVRIHFKSSNFKKLLAIIKDNPSSLYDDRNMEWVVPINRLSSLVNDFNDLGEEVLADESVIQEVNDIDSENERLLKLKDKINNVKFTIPNRTEGWEPYPFQVAGAAFLWLKKRALLADVVGLGKTIEALSAIEKRFDSEKLSHCLVICPNSLKDKWTKDIKKFFNGKSIAITGSQTKRMQLYEEWAQGSKLYAIANYDTIRSDIEFVKYILEDEIGNQRLGIICDEIQYIKNYNIKRSRAIQSIAYLKSVRCFYGLSATYIENGLENLFGIFLAIDKSVFGTSYNKFVYDYLKIGWEGKIIGYKNIPDVVDKINIYTIRRQKEQVIAQLPSVNYIDYNVELTAEQKFLYEDIVDKIVDEINDPSKKASVARASAMSLLGLLNQACLSSELFDSGSHSSKIEELLQIAESIDANSKIVIFSHYQKMVEIICRELNAAGFSSIYMHGGSETGKRQNREKTIQEWVNRKDIKVLVTSDILAEGVDLVAADYLINFDLLWNPAKMQQRNGRIDRISQKSKQITIINMITKNTVEEVMFERLEEKKDLIKTVVDGGYESGRINMLSLDDIKKLFENRKRRK